MLTWSTNNKLFGKVACVGAAKSAFLARMAVALGLAITAFLPSARADNRLSNNDRIHEMSKPPISATRDTPPDRPNSFEMFFDRAQAWDLSIRTKNGLNVKGTLRTIINNVENSGYFCALDELTTANFVVLCRGYDRDKQSINTNDRWYFTFNRVNEKEAEFTSAYAQSTGKVISGAAIEGLVDRLLRPVAGTTSAATDGIVIYKETCNHNAFETWKLTCTIDSRKFSAEGRDVGTSIYTGIESITICASFNNGGSLNGPASIVHNFKDGTRVKATELFDTVKFQGNLTTNRVSWVGTSPRFAPASWSMKAGLLRNERQHSFDYTETISNGQRPMGEVRASCAFLEDSK